MLIAVLGIAFSAQAQTKVTEVAPDGYISNEAYVYVFGSGVDTLTNADTFTHVIRARGTTIQDYTIKLYMDHVSGTAGGTLIVSSSIDGVNYADVDTITSASVTGDIMDTEVITLNDYLYPYVKFIYKQTGTAVTIPKVYIYTKLN